jgi:hypothetical protein
VTSCLFRVRACSWQRGDRARTVAVGVPNRRRHRADTGYRALLIGHGRVQITDPLAQLPPFQWRPAIRERRIPSPGGVQDASGGGAGDRFRVERIGAIRTAPASGCADHPHPVTVQDHQRRHVTARLHRQGMHRRLRDLPQPRVGLPVSPDACQLRPHVVAVLDALHRAEIDELLGEPICRGLRQATDTSQGPQSQPVLGAGERIQHRERALEHAPGRAGPQHRLGRAGRSVSGIGIHLKPPAKDE